MEPTLRSEMTPNIVYGFFSKENKVFGITSFHKLLPLIFIVRLSRDAGTTLSTDHWLRLISDSFPTRHDTIATSPLYRAKPSGQVALPSFYLHTVIVLKFAMSNENVPRPISWAKVRYLSNWREENVHISKVFETYKEDGVEKRRPFKPLSKTSFVYKEPYVVRTSQDMVCGEESSWFAYIGKLEGIWTFSWGRVTSMLGYGILSALGTSWIPSVDFCM